MVKITGRYVFNKFLAFLLTDRIFLQVFTCKPPVNPELNFNLPKFAHSLYAFLARLFGSSVLVF